MFLYGNITLERAAEILAQYTYYTEKEINKIINDYSKGYPRDEEFTIVDNQSTIEYITEEYHNDLLTEEDFKKIRKAYYDFKKNHSTHIVEKFSYGRFSIFRFKNRIYYAENLE